LSGGLGLESISSRAGGAACRGTNASASHRLVVEIDGAVHAGAEARALDARRTAELGRLYGVRVMRLPAGLVERDVEAAVALVRAALG